LFLLPTLAPTNAPTKTPTEEPTTNEDANKESDKGTKDSNKGFNEIIDKCAKQDLALSTHSKLFTLELPDYTILTKSGISTVPRSIHHRQLGVSPIMRLQLLALAVLDQGTGFQQPRQFGQAFAASYGGPVAAALTVAVLILSRVQRRYRACQPDVARINRGRRRRQRHDDRRVHL
jgi:hypothetical protein